MLNIPPHLEACRPRGLFSIFHGTSSPVARRCPRASDLVLSAEHAFLLYERPGLHLQSGASAVGGVLHGARRSSRCFSFGAICDFNPRAPCGARRRVGDTVYTLLNFNPRTPCGVRPMGIEPYSAYDLISIHAPRAGCDRLCRQAVREEDISIHAPRAGCDITFWSVHSLTRRISIHAPRAGCDRWRSRSCQAADKFQSTHPVRGATYDGLQQGRTGWAISIHAPRAGCDPTAAPSPARR